MEEYLVNSFRSNTKPASSSRSVRKANSVRLKDHMHFPSFLLGWLKEIYLKPRSLLLFVLFYPILSRELNVLTIDIFRYFNKHLRHYRNIINVARKHPNFHKPFQNVSVTTIHSNPGASPLAALIPMMVILATSTLDTSQQRSNGFSEEFQLTEDLGCLMSLVWISDGSDGRSVMACLLHPGRWWQS